MYVNLAPRSRTEVSAKLSHPRECLTAPPPRPCTIGWKIMLLAKALHCKVKPAARSLREPWGWRTLSVLGSLRSHKQASRLQVQLDDDAPGPGRHGPGSMSRWTTVLRALTKEGQRGKACVSGLFDTHSTSGSDESIDFARGTDCCSEFPEVRI